tara:strand:- start:3830 stop:6985 length:3156 start_codon:yes stop_codon:yes gene_type:complete
MSVKKFKFVSPGVFINEIDNSFLPKESPVIGPVVIGRAERGIAMTPVRVSSYSEFVEMFGDVVPGGAGSDVSRDGNLKSPMYGTFATKAFLDAGVAPITYVRLLGNKSIDADNTVDSLAGWRTLKAPSAPAATNVSQKDNGGAYGLFIFLSSSATSNCADLHTGSLAAVWYLNQSASIALSGTLAGPSGSSIGAAGTPGDYVALGGYSTVGMYAAIKTDSNNLFTAEISSSLGNRRVTFGFDDTKNTFIRDRFNTNPQLASDQGAFYPSASSAHYWLGETFEQTVRDMYGASTDTAAFGAILPLAYTKGVTTAGVVSADLTRSPRYMKIAQHEARTSWFIGQDWNGTASEFAPEDMTKLFRFIGRGHGEWLRRNIKISIEKIRQSNNSTTKYGSFSVVVRSIKDSDNAVVILERFDKCSLDPTSPNFVGRKIGDMYQEWDTSENRWKTRGDYQNNSKFVYIDIKDDVANGTTEPTLVPWGYYGPPRLSNVGGTGVGSYPTRTGVQGTPLTGSITDGSLVGRMVYAPSSSLASAGPFNSTLVSGTFGHLNSLRMGRSETAAITLSRATIGGTSVISGAATKPGHALSLNNPFAMTASLAFPTIRLRLSASEGGITDPTKAYFGIQTTRLRRNTTYDPSCADVYRLWHDGYPSDPTTSARFAMALSGVMAYDYIFTMDDVCKSSKGTYYYLSGARANGNSYGSYKDLITAGYDSFTAPLWGGHDGWNVLKPDPVYNQGMSDSATEANSYVYHTWKRAADTVADPEVVDMNILTAPGLTNNSLTQNLINICEDRGDALAVIDLPDVYIPSHEKYYSSKTDRIGSTPRNSATALKDRQIDSSYGCTFYPWVLGQDVDSGRRLWLPPSVAVMGVLASSEKKTHVWFAPAGFNRASLTDGAAGMPISEVTEVLTSKERDLLYKGGINPIASFPNTGIIVFGQKTLQERRSALDRINVRRLVIYLKKNISVLSTQILFEQNVEATWNRFKSLIEPFLSNVKVQFGISDYKLILDETTTTPDLIDQNILYAKIMVKPTRAIEFIAIDFVVASTGASFDD